MMMGINEPRQQGVLRGIEGFYDFADRLLTSRHQLNDFSILNDNAVSGVFLIGRKHSFGLFDPNGRHASTYCNYSLKACLERCQVNHLHHATHHTYGSARTRF